MWIASSNKPMKLWVKREALKQRLISFTVAGCSELSFTVEISDGEQTGASGSWLTALLQQLYLNQNWIELKGMEWGHTNPIGAKSAKPSLHCPPTQRVCVWPQNWKLLTCQRLRKRSFSTEIHDNIVKHDIGYMWLIPVQAITNKQFGSWSYRIFLK